MGEEIVKVSAGFVIFTSNWHDFQFLDDVLDVLFSILTKTDENDEMAFDTLVKTRVFLENLN
jgi:hypothetical protein